MEDRFKRQGAFSWQELMTDDVAGAKKFYTELLGWTLEEFPMGEGESYWVVKAGEEGILVPPTDIPQVGRFATLQDPQGAAFSIITYAAEM
jgi:predicted enzyme related to lactoylglutathione lyase